MRRLAGLGLVLAMLFATAPTTQAATVNQAEHYLQDLVNAARVSNGLVRLRSDSRLWDLAGDRATVMARRNVLSHTVAGSISAGLAARHVSWYGWGETIAYAYGHTRKAAAKAIFEAWRNSPGHWKLLMSASMNYLGVGLARRASNGRMFASIVLTESKDHSGARAKVTGATRTDDDIVWTWSFADLALQTHTAGARDVTVQMRRDHGSWKTITAHTTATTRLSLNKVRGHWYGLRVRATDKRGNVGPWSAERRVWVP